MWKHEGNVETSSISTAESFILAAIAVNSHSRSYSSRHSARNQSGIVVNGGASISVS